jgi:uncharacterized protein YceH (UPF0502 family)
VRLAVRSLRERGLLRTVHRTGERSDKHRHLLDEALGLSTPQQVLLALLLLRGPQTAAELRARADRMHAFGSTEDVEDELQALGDRAEPLVALLPRQPGQKEARYAQLLAEAAANVLVAADDAPVPRSSLQEEVAALREEVAALRDEVAALRER